MPPSHLRSLCLSTVMLALLLYTVVLSSVDAAAMPLTPTSEQLCSGEMPAEFLSQLTDDERRTIAVFCAAKQLESISIGKRKNEFVRFGRSGVNKRKNEFVRFGKRKNEYVRFGKRKNDFVRFGKRKNEYVRFGKRKNDFIRFGKRGDELPLEAMNQGGEDLRYPMDKRKNEYVRFGKRKNEFVRFG